VRDASGSAAGLALNPLIFFRYAGDGAAGATGVAGDGLQMRIDADDQLKALFAGATDPYASFRSYFLQNREAEVNGGRIDIEQLPEFGAPETTSTGVASASTAPSTPAAVPASSGSETTAIPAPAPATPPAATGALASGASKSTLNAVAAPAMAAVAISVVGSATIAQP
jgi:phospholipid-binding lipoprotein MlaA